MSTLDRFLGISVPVESKYKWPDEEKCEKCGKVIKGIKYELTVKGKKQKVCQPCAKEVLRPLEKVEASI